MIATVEEYITAAEAGRRLGVSSSTVRQAIGRGDLKGKMVGGHMWMVAMEDLEKWTPRRKRGRHYSDAPRCPCQASTLRRAASRGFRCCLDRRISKRQIAAAQNRLYQGNK